MKVEGGREETEGGGDAQARSAKPSAVAQSAPSVCATSGPAGPAPVCPAELGATEDVDDDARGDAEANEKGAELSVVCPAAEAMADASTLSAEVMRTLVESTDDEAGAAEDHGDDDEAAPAPAVGEGTLPVYLVLAPSLVLVGAATATRDALVPLGTSPDGTASEDEAS